MLALVDCWIWDSWYTFDGEYHHAFYLKASRALGDPNRRHRHPAVGHARSRDLYTWEELPDALAIADAPAFDDWTTWTGSVVKDDSGTWWMFYTGTSHGDDGLVQRIGSATSNDLMTWVKQRSPLIEADPEHYELLGESTWDDQAWRDPFVFRTNDQWQMLITARSNQGSPDSRGVVGRATSSDLHEWKVQAPLATNEDFGQLEVLQVAEIDGVPTLLWCCEYPQLSERGKKRFGRGGMFSATGESMLGPFDMAHATRFDHDSIYAARTIQHEGAWFLMGFRNMENGQFIGELTDPIPVTSLPGVGLVPKD